MITLKIDGMTCNHCVMHVRQALAAVPGAAGVEVDLQAAEARVGGTADPALLIQAVEAEGYSAREA